MINIYINESKEAKTFKKLMEERIKNCTIENDYTIRWGNWTDGINKGIVFNSSQSIKNTIDKENVVMTLRKNHVRAPRIIKPGSKTEFPIIGRKYEHKSGNDIKIVDSIDECLTEESDYYTRYLYFKKEYRVHIIDQDVFFVEKKYSENVEKEFSIRTKTYGYKMKRIAIKDFNNTEFEKIKMLAQRSVHALGLDFGIVNIGLANNDRFYTIDVDSSSNWITNECLGEYIEKFIEVMKKYDEIKKSDDDITLGADPELILKDKNNNKLIVASELIKDEYGVGLDSRSLEASKKFFPIIEIRPSYSNNPIEVYKSIEDLFMKLQSYIHYKNIGIYGGSSPLYKYWIGGHIHFGIKPNTKLIKALDNYLALPIMMIEKTVSARQRNKIYGTLGNFRLKKHGGFEYCSLSSWLISPEIALGVLCLAKIIVLEYLNLEETFINDYYDIRCYYAVKKQHFKKTALKIIENLKNTKTYNIYKTEVAIIFNMIINNKEWCEDKDIKESWEINSSKKIYEILKTCNIPKSTRKRLNVHYGDNIKIEIGKSLFDLVVYPKDDSTELKKGYVNFSEDIHKEIGLNLSTELYVWKDKIFKAGPVVGILTDLNSDKAGLFGMQTNLLKKMIKLSSNKGIFTYVFTIDDINWERMKIKGYSYDLNRESWEKLSFPIPDVIYNKGSKICKEFYGNSARTLIYNIRKHKIKLINELDSEKYINNIYNIYDLLHKDKTSREFIPKISEYSKTALIDMLDTYNKVYFKSVENNDNASIYTISYYDKEKYEILKEKFGFNDRYTVDKDLLLMNLQKSTKEEGNSIFNYVIIPCIEYEKNKYKCEIRSLMIKDGHGRWRRTAIGGRIKSNYENLDDYLKKDERASVLLKKCLQGKDTIVKEKINKISRSVTRVFDENELELGELIIDMVIDKDLNIYFMSIDSKPKNFLYDLGAYKRINIALNRILDYSRSLIK